MDTENKKNMTTLSHMADDGDWERLAGKKSLPLPGSRRIKTRSHSIAQGQA